MLTIKNRLFLETTDSNFSIGVQPQKNNTLEFKTTYFNLEDDF